MSAKRIVVSGYYGFDNAGDEAVLAGLVQSLKAAANEVQITALSIDPTATAAEHSIAAAHRYRLGAVLGSILRSDALLSGGGSLLQDVTSAHGIFYYLAVVRAAQILGRKTMFVAQGIGPLIRRRSQRLVAGVANRLDAITVRDTDSQDLLQSIGVRRPIEVTADPALLLTEPSDRDSQTAVVSLRPWEGADDMPAKIAGLCANHLAGYRVATLAMQPGKDAGPMEQFGRSYAQIIGTHPHEIAPGDARAGRLRQIVEAIADSRIVVGMRLHALILAAAAGVPSIALAYDPKIGAFMRSTGQADAVCPLNASDTELVDIMTKIVDGIDERRSALRIRLPDLKRSARRNAEAALAILQHQS